MYWTGTGWSSPYFSLSRATIEAGTAFSRAQGPPGTACMSEKVISETTKRTGMIHKKRRAIYLIIRFLFG